MREHRHAYVSRVNKCSKVGVSAYAYGKSAHGKSQEMRKRQDGKETQEQA